MDKKLNSEIFLSAFNELEKHFKNEFFRGQWKSFKQMLKEGSRNNPIIMRFKEELFEFADLRNAIVHNRSHEFQVIAEPHDVVVKQIQEIADAIINPLKVDVFCKMVHTCSINDPISKAIELIHQFKVSQIPILNEHGNIYEVLNATNIAYWVAASAYAINKNDSISKILLLKELRNNFYVISEKASVYDAADKYKHSYKLNPKNKYFDAILVTNNGLAKDRISGIIVLSDIAKYI